MDNPQSIGVVPENDTPEKSNKRKTIGKKTRFEVFKREWFHSIKEFNKRLPFHEVMEAAEIAFLAMSSDGSRFRYFCGICWRKIREAENAKPNHS